MPHLSSIQYLRGLAALMVVIFHATQRSRAFGTDGVADFGLAGAAGIDVFFVISGFVMWAVTERQPTSPVGFLARRAVRIIPLYWLCTLAMIPVLILVPQTGAEPTAWDIVRSFLFIPYEGARGLAVPLLEQGWTLNLEAFFYALFAIGLILPAARRAGFILGVLAVLTTLGLIFHPPGPAASTYTDPRLIEFGGGVVLARWWLAGLLVGRGLGAALTIVGVGGLIVAALFGPTPDAWRPLAWGCPSIALVAGLVAIEASGGLPRLTVLHRIGDASFSIYLTHVFLLGTVRRAIGLITVGFPPMAAALAYVTASVAVSLCAGLMVWRWVEQPLTNALRFKRPEQRDPILVR